MAVDALAQREGVKLTKLQYSAAVARCNIDGQRVLLAKPMTFMNESGKPVSSLAKFYKVSSYIFRMGTTVIPQKCRPGVGTCSMDFESLHSLGSVKHATCQYRPVPHHRCECLAP